VAIAMKTEPSPQIPAAQIVEIIDDDGVDDAFVGLTSNPTKRTTGRGARWVAPGVAAALLAVVGYAVISSSATSTPPAPSTPGQIKSQYFVADAPAGFTMYLAEARGETGSNPADFADTGSAQLWATSGATATTGSWFVISRGGQHATGRNSYRTVVDGSVVIVEHDPASGQSRLSFTKNGQEMAITAFGWVDRQLLRLVRAASIDNSNVTFSDNFFMSDHQLVVGADPTSAFFGLPIARVGYTMAVPASMAENFTVTVGGDIGLNSAQVAQFALGKITTFTVGDVPAIIGQSASDPGIAMAQWHDGRRLVTISGNLDEQRLQSIAQTVHESPSATVHRQLQASIAAPNVAALQANPKIVVSGMLADGRGWSIGVSQTNANDTRAGYLWWIGQPGDAEKASETRASIPGDAPSIDTFVEHGRTYVLATIPRSMVGAQLHVNPTGKPSLVTSFDNVDAGYPDLFSASVFLEPVPFTAEIIGPNGTSVAFWPPT
jgi:hypothetical protein